MIKNIVSGTIWEMDFGPIWENLFMKAHNGTEVMDKPGYELIVKKSNEFVQAKYKTTLLEQKIVALQSLSLCLEGKRILLISTKS